MYVPYQNILPSLTDYENVLVCNTIIYKGTTYKSGYFLFHNVNEVCEIIDIIAKNEEIKLVCKCIKIKFTK